MKRISSTVLLFAPLAAAAATWQPLPASLWAMQAVVPPGTNNTQVLQTVPGVFPVGVPAGVAETPTLGSSPAGPGAGSVASGIIGGGRAGSGTPQPTPVKPAVVGAGVVTTPASVPTRPNAPACNVRLQLGRTELPASGGEFAVPAVLEPAGCPAAIAFDRAWLALSDAGALRFKAEPNTSAAPRDASIVVGGRSFYVRQLSPPQPGLAAAPSALVFGLDKRGRADERMLTVWAERGLGKFVATPGDPWLLVTPKRNKNGRQSYEVSVRRDAGLRPGRHDSYVELVPAGVVPQQLLRIPVVVEVFGF